MTHDERVEAVLKRAFESRGSGECPGESALVAFYRGRLSEAEAESVREHLAACAACVELARDARAFVEAMGDAVVPAMPPSRATRWLAAAAVLAVALLAGIWLTRTAPVAPDPETRAAEPSPKAPGRWQDLPVAAAAYPAAPEDELVFRSDEPRADEFREAMAPYVRGDHAAAEAALTRFLASHPGDAGAAFYRGVSLLLLGRPEEAAPLLESAAGSPEPPDEARWYLALALLKAGEDSAALRALEAVAGVPGPRQLEAKRLAGEVRGALDAR
jgi:tetratricopeptide (TPR) repeat protein